MSGAAPQTGGERRPFVHLHTHSEYSLLDGMSRLSQITRMAARDGMPAVAMTDHGNLIGALKFHRAAREEGVKPILGCEAYVAPGDRKAQNPDSENQHLVLLARNQTGFRNLVRLSSIAYSEGFYFKPRMDFDLLERHHEGLIALSACPKGIVPREVLNGGDPVGWAGRYQEVFGKGNYYLEIMDHTPPGGPTPEGARLSDLEARIRAGVIETSRKTGIPLVGTNDSHYATPEDADAHDLRLCISVNRPVRDPKRLKFHSDQFFFKTSEQMETVFDDAPDAYRNTLEIAEQIEDFELVDERKLLPDFEVPPGKTLDAHFEDGARRGLARRLETPEVHGSRPPRSDYEDRLAMELEVIRRTGYSAYFLIVQDFIRFAHECDIPVGPGRGSAAGSLVAYALGITDIDPLAHGLLFERFLNPDRVSPPDIDVDFCEVRREEVLDYVTRTYGNDRVAQIMTLGTMQAKLVIRDVGRMLELPPPRVDRLAKLIPDGTSLKQALESVPDLRRARQDPETARLFELAERLEGLPRNIGTHAAGVVIAPAPLQDILPLYRDVETKRAGAGKSGAGAGPSVTVRRRTQWDMTDCEAAGLFKMDFLGLRNLTQIDDCARRVDEDENVSLSPEDGAALAHIRAGRFEKLPPDPETFRLFARADTDGIFQFESQGMRALLASYRPESLDDLAAMNALYRPGPLESGMTADFVAAKKKGRLSEKLDPQVRELFPETRGLIVYQEQVMLVAQRLAGYSLGQADLLRKAMGKKNPEAMAREEGRFVRGATAGGLSRKVAEETFQQIAKFAGYGFNRSHAVGYALVAYVAGWLKTHFPLHFLASLLTAQHRSGDKDERIARIRQSAQAAGIEILPPDIQRSGAEALVEGNAVRYGLGAIKQVGDRAAREIERARRACGRFESLHHFLEAVEPKALNRGVVEALGCAGALDFLEAPRSRLLPAIPAAIERAQRARGRKAAGVQSLFGVQSEAPVDVFPEARPWSEAERLQREREALGFYWEGHAATEYRAALEAVVTGPVEAALAAENKAEAGIVGLVRDLRKRTTRAGRPMGHFDLEDETGTIGVVVFPDFWESCPSLESEPVVLVRGTMRKDGGRGSGDGGRSAQRGELVASEVLLAEEAPYRLAHRVELLVAEPDQVGTDLQDLLSEHPGQMALLLRVRNRGVEVVLETATPVRPSRAFARAVWDLLGPDTLRLDGRLPPSPAH